MSFLPSEVKEAFAYAASMGKVYRGAVRLGKINGYWLVTVKN